MYNRTQQRFDRSIREAIKAKPAPRPRKQEDICAARADAVADGEIGRVDRRVWKLRLDPATGATIWGPI